MNATYHRQTALLLLLAMVAVIASVQGFEHLGVYIPCKLCLAQRLPYYLAMPVALFALASAWRGWSPAVTRIALAVTGALMLWTCGLGIYHAGVEWGWWPGPDDCGAVAGGISADVNDLLADLTARTPPSCTDAAGRFLGLSFAGWNVLASLALALFAFRGAMKR
ncbi:MAG: disulfide bond formation protein B [Pseudomonadota bacterium]|nr:disulfide bond formation protein B [Pseudomonadota bacterium]